jgi:hypothetical protein
MKPYKSAGGVLDSSNPKRPLAVWLIFLFYLAATGFTLLGFILVHTGTVPLNEAQEAYFANFSIFDYISAATLGALNITAAVLFFRLRRIAIPLIAGALALNLALSVRAVFRSNWIEAMPPGGLLGACLAWFIALAV